MATSLTRRKSGAWELQFWNKNNQKKTITLPGTKFSKRFADGLRDVVQVLLYNDLNSISTLDSKTKSWLDHAPHEVLEKLQRVGLITVPKQYTTGELWTTFIAEKEGTVEDSTVLTYKNSSKHFLAFFGKGDVLSDLTKEKMIEWKANVLSSVPVVATATGIVSRAKTVFNWAVRQGWIEQSPLKGIGAGSHVNKEKDHFIAIPDYSRLLDACRSPDWRVIIALARIGGFEFHRRSSKVFGGATSTGIRAGSW